MHILWYLIIPKLKGIGDMVAHNMVANNIEDDITMVPIVDDNTVVNQSDHRRDYIGDYMKCFMNGNEGCEVILYE